MFFVKKLPFESTFSFVVRVTMDEDSSMTLCTCETQMYRQTDTFSH